jgi:aspartate-semialdehyde dehydrogenase
MQEAPHPRLQVPAQSLQDASNIDALKKCDIIITAQGGDYTSEVFPAAACGRLERPLDRCRIHLAHEG